MNGDLGRHLHLPDVGTVLGLSVFLFLDLYILV
jgi:hypothetical protein